MWVERVVPHQRLGRPGWNQLESALAATSLATGFCDLNSRKLVLVAGLDGSANGLFLLSSGYGLRGFEASVL